MGITTITKGIILHQVNCKGVMGCGVALAIRNRWPIVYNKYREHFKEAKLGMIQIVRVTLDLFVINLFAQDRYGRDKRYTDYNALNICLKKVDRWQSNYQSNYHRDLSIYIPYKMGCSNAGGDWATVHNIIKRILPNAKIIDRNYCEKKVNNSLFEPLTEGNTKNNIKEHNQKSITMKPKEPPPAPTKK